MRAAGLRTIGHNLTFHAYSNGLNVVSFDGTEFSGDLQVDEVNYKLVHHAQTNFERHSLHMGPHHVHSYTSVRTEAMHLEVYLSELHVRELRFNFIDFDLHLPTAATCLEGIWGRTSCYEGPFDASSYEVRIN